MGIPYRERFAEIITAGGGVIEDERYVTRPGVIVMNVTESTQEADALCDLMGLDSDLESIVRVAAFDGRITYLAFPASDNRTGEEYLREIVEGLGHTSVTARGYASVLFAGISLEDSLELVAGRAGRNARLTSSDTNAQNDTLYCLHGSPEQHAAQRAVVEEVLAIRARVTPESVGGRHEHNKLNLGNRATLLHIGMCLEDWHGIFRGRLPRKGNELCVREAFARACHLLRSRFPHVIHTPADYGFSEELP